MVVVEIRRRRLRTGCRFASSVDTGPCQQGPCQPARFSKMSLLLLPASSAVFRCCYSRCFWCTRVHTHAASCKDVPRSVSPARGNVVSSRQEIWSTPLSGEAWPIQSVRRVLRQQNAAVESHINLLRLYRNMLPKND